MATIKKTYDEDTDYQSLINKAVESGDYKSAARYEQQRNAKIADLDASGSNKWNATATNNYSQYLMPENYQGSSVGVGVNDQNQASIRDQMNKNSIAWWDADETGRAALEAANQALGAQLGGSVAYDPESGTWSGNAENRQSNAQSFDYSGIQSSQPTYDSKYEETIDQLLNQILNRDAFSYNALTDPLYQQYAQQYQREGNRAMNDTLAAAAAQAGGMNSYAVTAAQQANDYYSAQLGDKVPELYQLAYQMYLDDLDLQMQDLGLVQQMDDTQYGRYRDTMSDWRDDRDFAYKMYRDDVSDQRYGQEWDYSTGQASQTNARAELDSIIAAGGTPSAELIAASGYTPEYIAAMQALYAPSASYSYTPAGDDEEDIENLGGLAKGIYNQLTRFGTDDPNILNKLLVYNEQYNSSGGKSGVSDEELAIILNHFGIQAD